MREGHYWRLRPFLKSRSIWHQLLRADDSLLGKRNIRLSAGGSVTVKASFDQNPALNASQATLTPTASNQSKDTPDAGQPLSEVASSESNNEDDP
jgi:hypothetical protein